jgi:hypothetical protein
MISPITTLNYYSDVRIAERHKQALGPAKLKIITAFMPGINAT